MALSPPSRSPDAPDEARVAAFVDRVLAGEQRAGARTMRLVDDRHPLATELLRRLHPHTGRAQVIGVTGNPGSGKSTLTDRLVAHYRRAGHKVGVVAIDPSSPFSGGAILGDRIRMNDHALDAGVFIRSVATRGHLGGLSRSTNDIVHVLDAMGYDPILVETVGVGQDEVEVVRIAHTSVVVTVPGLGDDIQAIKAGLLEIADVFVVNKADRDGVDRTIRDIRALQSLVAKGDAWVPPVVRTVAVRDEGVDALVTAIAEHRASVPEGEAAARDRRRVEHVLLTLVKDRLVDVLEAALGDDAGRDAVYERLLARQTDPYTECERILHEILPRRDGEEKA